MSGPTTDAPWTTRRLLGWMGGHFAARRVDAPRLVAEMLLAHVLGCERLRLYMEADRPASPDELDRLRGLVRRAAEHEPVQHLVGRAWFFGREYEVDGSTLIPRPSTETLVEHVLQRRRAAPGPDGALVADVGTGTGCIAISLARQMERARVVATDVEPAALALARRNAERHGVADRIELREGDGLEPLRAGAVPARLDVLCANPPYVSDAEWAELDRNVKDYEPARALRGGPDGLDVIRPLVTGAADVLAPGGLLAVEIAHAHHDAALALAEAADGLDDATVLRDHEGWWRVLVAERAG